jgi:hypothetical protein
MIGEEVVEGHDFSRVARVGQDAALPAEVCWELTADRWQLGSGGSNLRGFAAVTLSEAEGASPQPKSRAWFARDL